MIGGHHRVKSWLELNGAGTKNKNLLLNSHPPPSAMDSVLTAPCVFSPYPFTTPSEPHFTFSVNFLWSILFTCFNWNVFLPRNCFVRGPFEVRKVIPSYATHHWAKGGVCISSCPTNPFLLDPYAKASFLLKLMWSSYATSSCPPPPPSCRKCGLTQRLWGLWNLAYRFVFHSLLDWLQFPSKIFT